MTAFELFFYISIAITLQVAVAAAIGLRGHLRSYSYLQKRLAGYGEPHQEAEVYKEIATQRKAVANAATWEGFRDFTVVQKHFEDKAKTICSFLLAPTDGGPLPPFMPGQYLTFQLKVAGQEKPITRCYSLSDTPGRDHYRVSIKRELAPKPDLPPGLSSNHFHDHVGEGDSLQVRAPSGHFFLEPGSDPIVLIGSGIGITPMLSMLNASLERGSKREIRFYYGVRSGREHIMKDHLEALAEEHDNFHLHVCYSRPGKEDVLGRDYGFEGHIDVKLLRLTLPYGPFEFYICGPGPMMETIVPALQDWGVPEEHIHYEAFGPASIPRKARKKAIAPSPSAETFQVTFAKSGATHTWDGGDETLLDFAERHGIAMESGCRAGGCGCCQTEIKSGEVSYNQNPDYDPDDGTCLTCIAKPATDLTVEA